MSSSRYSPMTCLPKMSLTPSGLPQLDASDGEVELIGRDHVEIRGDASHPIHRPDGAGAASAAAAADWIDRDDGLACTLTTHRLVLAPSSAGTLIRPAASSSGNGGIGGRFVHLSMVAAAAPSGGPSFTSPLATYKITVSTYAYGDVSLVFRSPKNPSKDRDDVLDALKRALKRRAWEEGARAAERKKNSSVEAIAARKVGVDAIMTRNKLKHREAERLTDDAFADGDVDTLMREAGELVKIINKYVSTLEKDSGGSGGKEDDPGGADAAKLTGMLMDMGMTSALSKSQAAGGEAGYHQTVARQLSDFLRHGNRLKEAGGMMTLTDVYCLFNRARGTNLISPDDLLMALHWMGTLELGMGKREFPSGVVVVQDDTFDDSVLAEKLVKLAEEHRAEGSGDVGGITVLDASKSLKVSAMLANEQLLAAERMGRLCRDVTLEGVRFFPNLFETGNFESMCR